MGDTIYTIVMSIVACAIYAIYIKYTNKSKIWSALIKNKVVLYVIGALIIFPSFGLLIYYHWIY